MGDFVNDELRKYGFNNIDEIKIEEIRNKDGIFLYRIIAEKSNYILKYFSKKEHRREIEGYKILKELGIKTIRVYGDTDKSILLEDLEVSTRYRLGVAEDLGNPHLARALAKWYINLHDKGSQFVNDKGDSLYSENDAITKENIEFIRLKSNTENNSVWNVLLNNFDSIKEKINSPEYTLNYNDFYWTNLVVSKDESEAFMFDYNFLGKGPRYNDIRNICASLSKEAGKIFIGEYGLINEKEKIIDNATCHIITLIHAYNRQTFPSWGRESLEAINNGQVEKSIGKLIKI